MANHLGRSAQPDAPRVKWGSIVHTEKGWHLATMVTQGGKTLEQNLADCASKEEAEERFRVWSANELFGWEDE